MHFNTKYINQGDTKDEIVDKINYNFNQILSFGVGPDGTVGAKGLTGYRGPAGNRGIQGVTGDRATTWFKQPRRPTGSLNQYDLWINTASSNGTVSSYSATGSWNFTGFTIFDSSFFSAYSWILGPGNLTDKYVIGLLDTANAASQSLVISDRILGVGNSNPNNSKVVVSTADQISTPIFSFAKSGANSLTIPSFYWQNTGLSANLLFSSDGDFDVTSYLSLGIDTSSSPVLLNGSSFNSNSSLFSLKGTGDFDFSSNTTIGGGSPFSITTSNLTLASSYLTYANPLKISASNPGGYVLNDAPVIAQISGGLVLEVTERSSTSFRFDDLTGNPILSGKPFGPVSSGKFGQVIFGSTGGNAGGTGGPYSYHVRKTKSISLPAVANSVYTYPSTINPITLNNVIDISSTSYWDRNILSITPTSYSGSGGVYLRVPSTYLTTFSPVYTTGVANFYRILLNTLDTNPSTVSILGLVFSVADFSQNPNQPTSILSYLPFGVSGCVSVDLQWLGVSNLLNSNPRLFYRTSIGIGGYVNLTNYYSVGAVISPTSYPVSGGGGGGSYYTGGGGGGGRTSGIYYK